jgi:hypothetical protein
MVQPDGLMPRQLGVGLAVGIRVRVVPGEAHLQLLRGQVAQHDAAAVGVRAAALGDLAVPGRRAVRRHQRGQRACELRRAAPGHLAGEVEHVLVAVDALGDAGDAHEELVRHREVIRAAKVEAVRRAEGHLDGARVIAARFTRDQADGAAEAVLAEQRALRAAQHLDALEVEQVDGATGQGAVVDVVDVHTDAGVGGVDVFRGLHAAHADLRRGSAEAALRTDARVRYHQAQILDIVQALAFEEIPRHRGDGERRVLQVLAAELRRDDDLLEALLTAACRGLRSVCLRACHQ